MRRNRVLYVIENSLRKVGQMSRCIAPRLLGSRGSILQHGMSIAIVYQNPELSDGGVGGVSGEAIAQR